VITKATPKQIVFDTESRRRLQRGINKVADAVSVTLGPRGRNVVLEQSFGVPKVINDGVSIARAIELPDPVENAGAQLIKEVAGRTNDSAGDGTTTASVLARELIHFGLQAISAGSNPISIKRGFEKTAEFLVSQLKEKATHVKGHEDVKNVASISAGNDLEVGEMIADAIDRVGRSCVLSIETSNRTDTVIEVQEGMALDRGFISPQFATNSERLTADLENARVLVTDQKIESVRDLLPILEQMPKLKQPLLIIAEDVTNDALATLVINRIRGVLQVCAVKAPGFGERRKAMLEDIAILTGSHLIAKDLGAKVEEATVNDLGFIRKATINANNTVLFADKASRPAVEERVTQLKKELAGTESTYDAEKIQERIAKLSGGVAVIKVGAATEAELEDRKLRVEDAKCATFAALEEGIVPGGGAALLHLSELIPSFRDKSLTDPEERLGAEILEKALKAPCRIIANNAGVEGEVVVQKLLGQPFSVGYNAMTDEVQDLMAAGVIDPAKVTRSGLLNSISIAGTLLTTQAVVFEKPAGSGGKKGPGLNSMAGLNDMPDLSGMGM